MIIDGKSVTADEYLEHCLCLAEASDKSTEIKNKPRLCIRKYFKKRHCFTFERPGNAKTLRVLDKLEDKDLDEMFVEDTKKFIDYVWNECKPMSTPTGSPVTGSSMFNNLFTDLRF